MKNKRTYIIILSVVYVVLFIFKKTGIYFPFISDYLSDLICIPIVLGWMEILFKKMPNKDFQWNYKPVLVAVIYFSLIFEWLMPNFSHNYTADLWDVVCYFLGGIIFYFSLASTSASSKHLQPN